jgi:hydrogenase nickel incorporation protein HypA/HybF
MHELSIATALAESLITYSREHNVKISCVHIKAGILSGIDPEALQFAWEPALENFPGSGLEKCRLEIKMALLKHRCKNCNKEFEFDKWQIECPECRIDSLHRESGNEFLLESIEVENV